MEILRNPNFDFMKYRRFWIAVSFATIVAGLIGIFFFERLNFGVDFAGGTQLTIKFRDAVDVEELRNLVAASGFKESVIQRFGAAGANEVMIRTPILATENSGSASREPGSAALVLAALDRAFNEEVRNSDLNRIGALSIQQLLVAANPDGVGSEPAAAHYAGVAEAVMKQRKAEGMFSSWDQLARVDGLSSRGLATLQGSASLGAFSVLGVENVGPQVGAELRKKGVLAVVGALVGMLGYIWLRFELRFGIGATMATLHDILITLGIFAWMGYEFNLTTVAAFLTLIGYSVNDTVVTFDRVRENMRKGRSLEMVALLNRSINQTLSRTILTGGTTILVSLCLLIYGGDVIRGFAFVMAIGVVVGTYSSIYIASPFALLWEEWFGKNGRFRKRAAEEPGRRR